MELNIAKRLVLMGILPNQGNVLTHRLIGSLKETLGFTDEEIVRFQPTVCGNINQGCVCGSKGFDPIPHLPAVKCLKCGREVGLGSPGDVVWRTRDCEGNELGDGSRDIDLSEAAVRLIVNQLKILNASPVIDRETGVVTAEGGLTPETLALYLMFVPEDEQQQAEDTEDEGKLTTLDKA